MAARNNQDKPGLIVQWEHAEVPDAKERILKAYDLLLADLNNPQGEFDKNQQNRNDRGRQSKP